MQQNNQPHNDQNRPPLTAENAEFVMLALLVSRDRSMELEVREERDVQQRHATMLTPRWSAAAG